MAEGYSTITVTNGATPLSEAQLTLQSLAPAVLTAGTVDAGTINFASSSGVLGSMGSAGRVLIASMTSAQTATLNSTHMLGGWAVVGNDFASYNSTFGIGALAGVGYAGYDVINATAGNGWQTSYGENQNLLVTTAFSNALPTPGITINALKVGNFTFSIALGAVLNLKSGGLILSGTNAAMDTPGGGGLLTAGGSTATGSGVAPLYLWNSANTYVINAIIEDNPITHDAVRVVINAQTGAIALTNSGNTYSGGTVVNTGTLTLSAPSSTTPVIPVGGLTINGGAAVTMTVASGQINPLNVVTVNGPGTLNLFGNNLLTGLVFNNLGGGTAGNSVPTVSSTSTFAADGSTLGTLTLTGATAITATSSYVGATSVLNGRVTLGAGVTTFDIEPILINGLTTTINPLVATLNIQSLVGTTPAIHKTGGGVLGFTTAGTYTGDTFVDAGGILVAGANGGSRFSEYHLADGTWFNLNGQNTTIGALSGSGTVLNSSTTGTTLTVGFDDRSTTFSGQFVFLNGSSPTVTNLTKIGAGTMTITSQAVATASTGTLTVNQGGVTYSGAGTSAFGIKLVNTGGTITLDNSGTNVNNRLLSPSFRFGGGTLTIKGNSAAATTETMTTSVLNGGGTVNLVPDPARALTHENLGTWNYTTGATLLVLGANAGVGLAPTAGQAAYHWPALSGNFSGGQGSGTNGTKTMRVRPDIVVDPLSGDFAETGADITFATVDSATGNMRALVAGEMESVLPTSGTTGNTTNYLAPYHCGSGGEPDLEQHPPRKRRWC